MRFTNVTGQIAGNLTDMGWYAVRMVRLDGDGWTDLLIAGEWMPLKILKNVQGKFKDVSAPQV